MGGGKSEHPMTRIGADNYADERRYFYQRESASSQRKSALCAKSGREMRPSVRIGKVSPYGDVRSWISADSVSARNRDYTSEERGTTRNKRRLTRKILLRGQRKVRASLRFSKR